MKACFKCGTTKPLTEFYVHRKMADGHLNKCKDCTRSDVAARVANLSQDPAWAVAERKRHRVKSAKARAAGVAKETAQESRDRIAKFRAENPEKYAAHKAVGYAIRSGKLKKQPCEKCGAIKVQAHHDDYSKPLVVRWLCVPHHNEHHVQERERELLAQLA